MTITIPEAEFPNLPQRWQTRCPNSIRRPKTFRRKLKIKNCCSNCGKKWTSMKGLAEFKIGYSASKSTKFISCELYQQKCKRCGIFADPGHYDQEFSDIVLAVTTKFDNPKETEKPVRGKNGNPRGFHLDCEACEQGIEH